MSTENVKRGQKKSRNRGVRLSSDATELIGQRLLDKWMSNHHDAKLTREARAEYMGLSLATSDRVLNGDVVDRATILLVFKNLGLPWNEEYISSKTEEDQYDPESQSNSYAIDPILAAIQKRDPPRRVPLLTHRRQRILFAAVSIVILLLFSYYANKRYKQWEINEAFIVGSQAYQQGNYAEAKRKLSTIFKSAYDEDSAGSLASALRLAADIDSQEGNLSEAVKKYESSLIIWRNMRRPNAFPALHEAIGDAQTQLGQLDSAQTNLTLALNGFRQMKDSVGIAMAMRDLGSIQSAQGNLLKAKDSQEKLAKEKFEQAIDWFDQALASLRSEKKQDLQIDIVARRAVAMAHLGEVDTAIDTLNAACRHWETQKHTRWVAQTDYQMAQVELIRGNRARAKKYADESINGFSMVNDKFGVAKVRELISQP